MDVLSVVNLRIARCGSYRYSLLESDIYEIIELNEKAEEASEDTRNKPFR